ncbi:MAG: hypothetical protein AAF664_26550, partial [Planctomycetota bacterium]
GRRELGDERPSNSREQLSDPSDSRQRNQQGQARSGDQESNEGGNGDKSQSSRRRDGQEQAQDGESQSSGGSDGDPSSRSPESEPRDAQAGGGQPGEQPSEQTPGQQGPGRKSQGRGGSNQTSIEQFMAGDSSSSSNRLPSNLTPSEANPVTGNGFKRFNDSLRDVEELVETPELQREASRIRDRVRQMRLDLRRNSRVPTEQEFDEMVVNPLRTLRRGVSEELLRIAGARDALVPIDRDPVPDVFRDAVDTYYQRLSDVTRSESNTLPTGAESR